MRAAFENAADTFDPTDFSSDKKKVCAQLASGYTPAKRRQEVISVAIFAVLFGGCLYKLAGALAVRGWGAAPVFVVAWVLGMVAADFASGVAHWGADTWGNIDWPLVGQTLIRSFREHHVDPSAITRHDFIYANADSCVTVMPLLLYSLFVLDPTVNSSFFWLCFHISLSLLVAVTNEIHKYAHMVNPPYVLRVLQDANIILTRGKHHSHHLRPWDTNYCITTGWLNGPLQAIGFWRTAETLIAKVTGLVPREDDQFWTNAAKLQKQ